MRLIGQEKDDFIKGKGYSLDNLEENLQTTEQPDLQNGDLGFKPSTKINESRENDQFYFNPKIANCKAASQGSKLNCGKSIYGQEFAEGWFV